MKHLVCIRSEDSWVGILSAWLFFIIVKTEIKKVNNQSTICVRYDKIKTEKNAKKIKKFRKQETIRRKAYEEIMCHADVCLPDDGMLIRNHRHNTRSGDFYCGSN